MRIFVYGILLFLTTLLKPVYADNVMKCSTDVGNEFFKVNPKKRIFYRRLEGQWQEVSSKLCPNMFLTANPIEVISDKRNISKTALYSECVWESKKPIEKKENPFLCNIFTQYDSDFNKDEFEKNCSPTESGGYVPTEEYKKQYYEVKWKTTVRTNRLLIDFETKQYAVGDLTYDCEIVR